MSKITPEDLVRYVYNETSPKKTEKIKTALQVDWDLRKSYEKLMNTKKGLSTINFSPRPETVNKIKEYAAKKNIAV